MVKYWRGIAKKMKIESTTLHSGQLDMKHIRKYANYSKSFETFDGDMCLEISQSKLGKGLIFINLINLKTGEIIQKTRDVNFLINRLWGKTLLRRRGWR